MAAKNRNRRQNNDTPKTKQRRIFPWFVFFSVIIILAAAFIMIGAHLIELGPGSPTADFNRNCAIGIGIYFGVVFIVRIIYKIVKFSERKKAKRREELLNRENQAKLEELRRQAEQNRAQNIHIDAPTANSQPNIVVNYPVQQPVQVPPVVPQYMPVIMPYPVFVNPQPQPQFAPGPVDNGYYNPNGYQNPSLPQNDPYMRNGMQSGYPASQYQNNYNQNPVARDPRSQYDVQPYRDYRDQPIVNDGYGTIYPDEPQLNEFPDNWIRKYRDPNSPNIICFEYPDCIRYFREDGNGNLSFISVSPK